MNILNDNNNDIFVVPFQNTTDIENGFSYMKHDNKIWRKYDSLGKFIPQDMAEGHNELQQIIPYVLVRSDKGRYLVFKNNFNEKQKQLMSMGINDHLKACDGLKEILFNATVRILLNTIDFNLTPVKFIGYVRSMDSDVADHLGVVFLLDLIDENTTNVKDVNNIKHDWLSLNELIEHYAKFETWSKHIINYLTENHV